MSSFSIGDKEIYYKEYGSGSPLLLIAGLGSDSVSWLPIIINLSKNFRLITFDNRGVGRSSEDNLNITIEEMANDCMSLIQHLNLKKVDVLGHSMGGMIAISLAIAYPKIVNRLILEATTSTISSRNNALFEDWILFLKNGMDKKYWFRNMFYWIFSPAFFDDEDLVKQAVNMAVNYRFPQSDLSFENQVKAISKFKCDEELELIRSSTLIVYGDRDMLFPKVEVEESLNKIPGSKLVVIPDAAHSIHMDNPEYFVNEVVGFLEKKI